MNSKWWVTLFLFDLFNHTSPFQGHNWLHLDEPVHPKFYFSCNHQYLCSIPADLNRSIRFCILLTLGFITLYYVRMQNRRSDPLFTYFRTSNRKAFKQGHGNFSIGCILFHFKKVFAAIKLLLSQKYVSEKVGFVRLGHTQAVNATVRSLQDANMCGR